MTTVHGEKWDRRFLMLANMISTWSKDPRTKVGCVIVRPDKTIASVGFNGFPRGITDSPEMLSDRLTKHKLILHAEENAILFCREALNGYSIYVWPVPPCSRCAAKIIQSGISYVVSKPAPKEDKDSTMDFNLANNLLCSVNIRPILYKV